MPHPGRIVYSHPPHTDGVSFFYIVWHQRQHTCELRAADLDGEKLHMEIHALEMLEMFENRSLPGAWWDEEVSRRAAKALRQLAQRRHLV
jgi:hypothetical protein